MERGNRKSLGFFTVSYLFFFTYSLLSLSFQMTPPPPNNFPNYLSFSPCAALYLCFSLALCVTSIRDTQQGCGASGKEGDAVGRVRCRLALSLQRS